MMRIVLGTLLLVAFVLAIPSICWTVGIITGLIVDDRVEQPKEGGDCERI